MTTNERRGGNATIAEHLIKFSGSIRPVAYSDSKKIGHLPLMILRGLFGEGMAYEKKSIAPLRIEYWIAVCNADLYSEESALLRYLIDGRWGRNESEGVETWVRFDKEGCVIFASQIMQIFTKYSIDRVRYCLVCNRFFWAKKSNAWSCSLKCASALGHRKRGKKKNA